MIFWQSSYVFTFTDTDVATSTYSSWYRVNDATLPPNLQHRTTWMNRRLYKESE